MPRISTVIYSIKQGIKSLKRNRMFSLASIATMTACLFLFGLFYFLLSNLSHAIKSAESNVGVTVFFDEGISDSRIVRIGEEITARAEVAYITFVSAEEAWERYKATSLNPEQIASFGEDNPLENSASYEVYLNDVSMQEILVRFISNLEGVRQVNDSQEVAEALNVVNRVVAIMTTVITAILIAVAVFLISTTISTGVAIRKQELSIMKLIGATDFFIKAPFFVEGLLLGTLGATLPLLCLYGTYHKVAEFVSEKYASVFGKGMALLDSKEIFVKLIPICFAIGIGIGVFGTWMTLKKQLRKIG